MTVRLTTPAPSGLSRSLYIILSLYLLSFPAGATALVFPPQEPLGDPPSVVHRLSESADDSSRKTAFRHIRLMPEESAGPEPLAETLEDLLGALHVMQDEYFVLWQGTWPTSIDWTAAVLGTHVSAALSSLTETALDVGDGERSRESSCFALENTINHFFSHTATFYFGENAFSLRNQAYDDMFWVVLNWLENIKFQRLHSDRHYPASPSPNATSPRWYGTQFGGSAAHRARLFYELASTGWDQTLCEGGMIWNPNLNPYKNAITNELYISASIAMYLYFPGDPVDSPFMAQSRATEPAHVYPHNPAHLQAAIDGYAWLKNSNMTGAGGLFADGFHISGWQSEASPGSRKCDVLNTMEYTYNQGVVLSGLRGLWLATGMQEYLQDGHELVHKVLRATGWPQTSSKRWAGLGRGGVLEDACDSHGACSQDGQTFKGIFVHHLAEFCRPLRPQEERFLAHGSRRSGAAEEVDWDAFYQQHLRQCRAYGPWVEHNARAALVTRDGDGKFGMWWGHAYRALESDGTVNSSNLPAGAVDYRNHWSDMGASTGGMTSKQDYNDRGRGRTVETQSGGVALLRALYQWQTYDSLS